MHIVKAIPYVVILLIGIGFGFWFSQSGPDVQPMGVPLPKPVASMDDQKKSLEGLLEKGSAQASTLKGDWSQFRGQDLDGINKEVFPLLKNWPKGGPPVLWKKDIAKGHAGVSIYKGRAYLLDYDSKNYRDVIRCLNPETGEELWNFSYPIKTKTNHGITRSVPAVNDKYVVTIGPKGQVYCLNSMTGEFIWSKSLVLEYGTIIPKWYNGQCPLLEGDKVLIAPCGPKGFIVKFDCATGNADWVSKNDMEWDMTHTSVVPWTLKDGTKSYVYCGSGGVAAVDAQSGEILWVNRKWKIQIAACSSPLPIDGERLFLSAGYSVGSMMMKVTGTKEAGYKTETLFRLKEKDFGSVQHTPILYKGHIYGTRPNHELVCLDFSGKVKWSSGTHKYGIGPFMMNQGYMFLLDSKTCKLSLVEINPDSFKPLMTEQVMDGHDAYGLMALAGGILIVRDLKTMVALDVSKGGYKSI